MGKYILKRLFLMIPVLLGVSFIIFSIMALTPGDPAMMILGEGAPAEALEAKREELGLNDPFFVRYFVDWGKIFRCEKKKYKSKFFVNGKRMLRIV